MEGTTLLIGQASAEQIAKWKEQNKLDIFAIKKQGRIAYFKYPSFQEMDSYHVEAQKTDNLTDGWKAMAETLFIGGDKELISSPRFLPGVIGFVKAEIHGAEAEVVNL